MVSRVVEADCPGYQRGSEAASIVANHATELTIAKRIQRTVHLRRGGAQLGRLDLCVDVAER